MSVANAILTFTAALAAAVAGIVYLIKLARKLVRLIDRLVYLADRELTLNGGTSMKDDLHHIKETLDTHGDLLSGLRADQDALASAFKHHTASRRVS